MWSLVSGSDLDSPVAFCIQAFRLFGHAYPLVQGDGSALITTGVWSREGMNGSPIMTRIMILITPTELTMADPPAGLVCYG